MEESEHRPLVSKKDRPRQRLNLNKVAEDVIAFLQPELRRRDVTVSANLSQRELQVLRLAIAGLLNKRIASRLKLTERTVNEHRSRVMKKTGIDSIAELARCCERGAVEFLRKPLDSERLLQQIERALKFAEE